MHRNETADSRPGNEARAKESWKVRGQWSDDVMRD